MALLLMNAGYGCVVVTGGYDAAVSAGFPVDGQYSTRPPQVPARPLMHSP